MENNRKVKRTTSKNKAIQTLPSESLSEIFILLHQRIYPNAKPSNNRPNGIWITMSPNKDKDSALDKIGHELEHTFNINMLNNKKPLVYNGNLQESLENLIKSHLAKSKTLEPNINLFLTAHGAPSWFFGPCKDYHGASCGLLYTAKPLNDEQKDEFIDALKQSYFIFSHENLYFFNKETHEFFEARLSPFPSNHDGNYFFNQIKNILSKSDFENLTQYQNSIDSLPYYLYSKINQLFDNPPNFLESKFKFNSFVKDECQNAAVMATIFNQIENNLKIKFTSVVLFSCNSASEFINHDSLEASLSPARILSNFLKDRFVIGNIGKNSNGKTTGLFQKTDQHYTSVSPKLEKTLIIYVNQKVCFQPKDEFYLDNQDNANFCYLSFFKKNESYSKYSYVFEEMMNLHKINSNIMCIGGYGLASLQLQVMEDFLNKLTNTNSSNKITLY